MSIVWLGVVLVALPATGKVITTKPGATVTFQCEISTSTSSLTWSRGNDKICVMNRKSGFLSKGSAPVAQRSKVKRETHLEISQVKKEDAGQFACSADGNSQEFTLLVVSVSASPSEVRVGSEVRLHCEVEGLGSDSTVKWIRPDGKPQPGAGTVHLNRVTPTDEGTWVCTFSYDTETFNEHLLVKIKAPTPSTPISSTTQSSKVNLKTPCPSCGTSSVVGQFDWWVWAAVGVGAFFVVLLTVCVIVLCRRIKRRKKKLQKMRGGRQSLRPRKYCQCNCPPAAAKPQPGRQKGRPPALPMKPLLME